MKLYFAGTDSAQWLECVNTAKGDKSLCNYFNMTKGKGKKAQDFLSSLSRTLKEVFLDSGGYSAWNSGITIDINKYIKFIKGHKDIFHVYANLDVIGDFNASMKNQLYMEADGLAPLPVFHYGSDIANLKGLIAKYDYIALGGLVPISRNRKLLNSWLDKVFSIIKNNAKVHGFGVTSPSILKRYPFYLVDSTSWVSGATYAEVYFFDKGDMSSIKVNDKQKASQKTMSLMDSIQGNKLWNARVINNVVEWLKMEEYITRLWEKRGIAWND